MYCPCYSLDKIKCHVQKKDGKRRQASSRKKGNKTRVRPSLGRDLLQVDWSHRVICHFFRTSGKGLSGNGKGHLSGHTPGKTLEDGEVRGDYTLHRVSFGQHRAYISGLQLRLWMGFLGFFPLAQGYIRDRDWPGLIGSLENDAGLSGRVTTVSEARKVAKSQH